MKTKIVSFTLLLIFLFYFSLFVAGFFPLVAKYKLNFNSVTVLRFTKSICLHPISNIKYMYMTHNPLLFGTTGAALILFIYLLYKLRTKDYETVGEKYGVQGSSRWAKDSEIFKVSKQLAVVPIEDMYDAAQKSLQNREVE